MHFLCVVKLLLVSMRVSPPGGHNCDVCITYLLTDGDANQEYRFVRFGFNAACSVDLSWSSLSIQQNSRKFEVALPCSFLPCISKFAK